MKTVAPEVPLFLISITLRKNVPKGAQQDRVEWLKCRHGDAFGTVRNVTYLK